MNDNRYERTNRSSTRGGYRPGTGSQAPYRNSQPAGHGGPRPVWVLVVIDVLVIGLALNVYALFHHILPRGEEETVVLPGRTAITETAQAGNPSPSAVLSTDSPTATPGTSAGVSTNEPSPTDTAAPTATPPDVPVNQGMWGAKFPEKFTSGEIEKTANSYKSKDINITVTRVQENGVIYYVTDVYVRNLENFKTGYGNGKYGGKAESVKAQSERYNAIYAINGDNYLGRYDGIVVRNGELKRQKLYKDVLVMYNDGSMKAFTAKQFNLEDIKQNGAWQVWNFGPRLLDGEGQPLTEFDASDIGGFNPRSAIGYFEPGHYCFVLVDGRGESKGVKLPELAQIMAGLGCKVAYNLDGGRTSVMTFMGEVANDPYEGGRAVSDTIYIAENQ